MKQKKVYEIQDDPSIEKESASGGWVLRSTPFIVCDIFLERYVTAGVLTILPLFLHLKLGLDQNTSTSIFHTFNSTMLLFTIFGTIVADTWFGLYASVVATSIIYVAGLATVTMAMVDPLKLPIEVFIPLGLIIMMVGSGSLKNNLNAFGGAQHKLPEQKTQLERYFSVQYFGVKCGSFLTRLISPMLRANVKCFGSHDCYSLSFGIFAGIMLFATLTFLIGTSQYKKIEPNGNMLVKVMKCVKNAIKEKSRGKQPEEEIKHWLDHAEGKYGKKLVMETKAALKVIIISLPVPIFWACLMQQRSRWIFQGTKMNGDLGWYLLNADQMIVINSLLAIILIPFMDKFIYPALEKIGIKTMLQRLIFGGVLIVIAFTLSLAVEIIIQNSYISILWQIPQFVLIAIAEIFVYLSHLNFAYKEAPASMKPVMMSLLYLSMAGGDFIVVIISAISLFPSQVYEFSFYVCLTIIDIVVLIFLTRSYKHVDHELLNSLDNAGENKA
ncbi:peptide transporter family 1-like [Chironomus tepperi]|uniref:peptide transporter family 1-like n=1 Tax=Chironomus tepperi TaxID=113505 RepID=UPI00391F5E40